MKRRSSAQRAAIIGRRQQPGCETGLRFLEWLAEVPQDDLGLRAKK